VSLHGSWDPVLVGSGVVAITNDVVGVRLGVGVRIVERW
jgi:hypothetical protein